MNSMNRKETRERVYLKFDKHCGYCGMVLNSIKDMQVDHIEPQWSALTADRYMKINSFDNLMPSCRSCNHYKRSDNLEQFRDKMMSLHKRVCSHYIGKVAITYGIVEIKPFDGLFYFEKISQQ